MERTAPPPAPAPVDTSVTQLAPSPPASGIRRLVPLPARKLLRRHLPARLRARLSPATPWSIRVATAGSPLDVRSADTRPVLDAATVDEHGIGLAADPFAVRTDQGWTVLFEVIQRGALHGVIAAASSSDLHHWDYHGVVLAEPFHLSYPSLVEEDGERFLVPESSFDGSVRLYRARSFPHDWVLDTVLLRGRPFKDATIERRDGRWWMFVEASATHTNDELLLFWADALRGPWHEHPGSPICRDAGAARPAGRLLDLDGRLLRVAQDCERWYGERVVAAEIDELTTTRYHERRLDTPLLAASGEGWNATGMHHLDAHAGDDGSWVCFVDGKA